MSVDEPVIDVLFSEAEIAARVEALAVSGSPRDA